VTNLLILLALPEKIRMQYHDHLKAKFPQVTVNSVDHHSKVDPYIASADVLITFGPMMAESVLQKARRLKWIQALGTGVDGIADRPSLRRDVVVTNMHGFHGPPVSEAAIGAMLALSRDLPRSLRNQGRHRWERFPARTLKDKTVAIFGVGVIAQTLAPICKAFGMTVIGVTSTKRALPGFDRMVGREELAQAARGIDYLVLLAAYTSATRGIVDEKVFAAMKPTSFLINLARGGVVDEAALIRALKEGKIAGAALDVFGSEPLPEDHPFWNMQNVIVTAHQGGFFDRYPAYALPVIEENLRRFLAGEVQSMINVVKR